MNVVHKSRHINYSTNILIVFCFPVLLLSLNDFKIFGTMSAILSYFVRFCVVWNERGVKEASALSIPVKEQISAVASQTRPMEL